ncbi:MAG: hypothetical protein KF774_09215 [Planctomyces sp.]|nr:hypothetical protein [Planctomyces sp.]
MSRRLLLFAATSCLLSAAVDVHAQERRGGFTPPPVVISPEVAADQTVTFRIYAPKAEEIRLSGDLGNLGDAGNLVQGEQGVWEAKAGPLAPGAYRYHLVVDGVATVDPANPATSESNGNSWSLLIVPGSEFCDVRDVPHGALAEVAYRSETLGRFRRMHVYTPPGYESGEGAFPVLYLLHGAMDSDDSWSTVGRAGVILDNLIADGKAKPMIVVMPHGHTGPFRFGPPGENSFERQMRDFAQDFANDIRPHIERTYRVKTDRGSRALAGLSMGGAQTLDIAIANLKDYGYLGVFSSGVFGIAGGPFTAGGPSWEERNAAVLDDAALKDDLKLVWFATGREDFLLETTRGTVKALEKHGFSVTYDETDGGHTWPIWRDYLRDFAPLLFQDD